MSYSFPPDVEKLVQAQMAECGYGSEDDVLRAALRALCVVQSGNEPLWAEIQEGIAQADRGKLRVLNIEALIQRGAAKLAEEGIVD